jgi:hypothetical protein
MSFIKALFEVSFWRKVSFRNRIVWLALGGLRINVAWVIHSRRRLIHSSIRHVRYIGDWWNLFRRVILIRWSFSLSISEVFLN